MTNWAQMQPDSQRFAGPPRSNGIAVASLVLGILGCVPFVTGVLAVIFGIIGIRNSRQPNVGGKGLAVAGLVLGIISVVAWTGFGGLLGRAYMESKPAGAVARQFLMDVSTGNANAATTNSSGFTAAQLLTQGHALSSLGALQSISFMSFNLSYVNGQATMRLSGSAVFANGISACRFRLTKIGGIYKVVGWEVSGNAVQSPLAGPGV